MFIFFTILIGGCANILPPSGGAIDTIPPKVVYCEPPNNTINFNSSKIKIEFNEYVSLSNKAGIIFSPPINPMPKITSKGKSVELYFYDTLSSSKTHIINFSKSIVDLNEGNVLGNFKYVFSTGPEIDSLKIQGQIKSLYDNSFVKNAVVGLYKGFDNLTGPIYYTFSDSLGMFSIENINNESFVLFSFIDENGNLSYDCGELASSQIKTSASEDNLSIEMFRENCDQNIIAKIINKNSVVFNHGLMEKDISVIGTEGLWHRGDYQSVFWFMGQHDFIKYQGPDGVDSIFINISDSAKVNFKNIYNLEEIFYKKEIAIASSCPIDYLNNLRFRWKNRKDSLSAYLENPFKIIIPISFELLGKEELIISSDAAINNNCYPNDSTSFIYNFNTVNYGSLNVSHSEKKQSLYIELYSLVENTVQTKGLSGNLVSFSFLIPGEYRVRIFEDSNHDGHWTPGNIFGGGEPEKIKFYPETIKIKANWEIDLDLKMS